MDAKEYAILREDLAKIHADNESIKQSLDGFRVECLKMLNDHDARIRELETFHARYGDDIKQLSEEHITVIDNQKAVANLRKFLWAVGTTAGGALVLTILNLIIEEGEKL